TDSIIESNSLTNSYRGLTQYCELLSDWLSDLEGDRRIVHECFKKNTEFIPIASGLLHYLQGFLLNNDLLNLKWFHFVLLDEISRYHQLYDRQSKLLQLAEMIIAKQRSIIDHFLHLLSVGFFMI
uniref:Uncharacterized protein n=1 Tax=Wuchereria bancrofti TaxID=6293 RepID=A0A1I8EJL4_WUCBA